MPYLSERDRKYAKTYGPTSAGSLNYLVTQTCLQFLEHEGVSYAAINAVIGALEAAKLEFYRRVACDYENAKIDQNGDVYS